MALHGKHKVALLAAMLVTFVTGSIHGFSVFLVPLEALLQLSRAKVSLIYSFALVFLTVAVLFGYLIYARFRPATIIVLACTGASVGLLISAFATSWWQLLVGYSLLFGTANGIGYGFVLQLVGKELKSHKGFAMAAVTAAYAVGSVFFSLFLAKLIAQYSTSIALMAMALMVLFTGLISGWLIHSSGARYTAFDIEQRGSPDYKVSDVTLLWFAYGCSVFAGLMAIGHAAGIVQALGGNYGQAVWGAVFIGIGSAMGGFVIGLVIRRNNINIYLLGLPLVSVIFLGLLVFNSNAEIAIILLTFVGFAYGALISVYPYAISVYFGDQYGPKVYGQVFTAWGFAGLAGPWSAGKLYDYVGNYSLALSIATLIAAIPSVVIWRTIRRLATYSSINID